MDRKRTAILFLVLFGVLFTAGCTLSSSSGQTSTPAVVSQNTPVATTAVSVVKTTSPRGILLLEKQINTQSGYQNTFTKFAFRDLGYEYLYPNDAFRIIVDSDKPVNVLVIDKTDEIKFSSVKPEWNTVLKKDQYDYSPLVPVLSQSNVIEKEMTFTITDKSEYFLIIDPRFASEQAGWEGTRHDPVFISVQVIKI
jgi:hypothetical protein